MGALSLNYGASLEGEDDNNEILPVFKDPTPGEIPELNEDIVQITKLETAIESLIDLAADIRSTGGINRQFAMEAERILPNTLSNPVNYYSNVPSATLLKVSMEEITKGVWALIAAGVVAVIALIIKVVSWFSGKKSDDSNGGKAATPAEAKKAAEVKADEVETAQKDGEEVIEAMQDLNKEIHNKPIEWETTSGVKIRYNSLDEVIAEIHHQDQTRYGRAIKFLTEPNPIHFDIVHTGNYSKFMYKSLDNTLIRDVTTSLSEKVRLLKELAEEDISSGDIRLFHQEQKLNALSEPLRVKHNGGVTTLKELNERISAAHSEVEAQQPKTNIHFDQFFSAMHGALKRKELNKTLREIPDLLKEQWELRDILEKFQGQMGDLSMDGNPGTNTEGVATHIRQCILHLGRDVGDLGLLLTNLEKFRREYLYLVGEMIGFSKSIVGKISRDLDASGGNIPNEWKKVMKERQKMLDEIEQKRYGDVFTLNRRDIYK